MYEEEIGEVGEFTVDHHKEKLASLHREEGPMKVVHAL